MRHRFILACAISASALSASEAFAQVAPSRSEATQAPSAEPDGRTDDAVTENGIEDIVVTANKRSESIDRVPLAIAAVTGETLRNEGVSTVQDLSRLVPSLNVTQSSFATDVYSIRNVGFYDTAITAVPAVSVYVDEAPLPFSVMSRNASLDPERVEVLMGPQGTLFGENSTGGAINYIAAKPTKDLAAELSGTVGNYGTVNADGYISGPLTPTLGARFSFRSLNSFQGWQESLTRNDRLGEVHQQQARLLFDWRPGDRLTVGLNVNGFIDKSDTQAYRYLGYSLAYPALAAFVPQTVNAPLATGGPSKADWDPDTDFRKDNAFFQVAVRAEYFLTDTLRITNVASYTHYNHDQSLDGDGLPFTTVNGLVTGGIRNFSEELRLSGETGALKFVLGAGLRKGTVRQNNEIYLDVYTSSNLPPLLFPGAPRLHNYEDNSRQRISSQAVFANLDYDLTDQFSVHAGGRYTNGKNKFNGCTRGDVGITILARSTNAPGECLTLLESGISGEVVSELEEDNLSWRFGVDFKPSSALLLYANASRGYKAGGYPVIGPATNYLQLFPALQEQLTSYEVGFKANLAGRTLRLSGALFHYDYADKQILGRVVVPVFGGISRLINIPKSEVNGGELSLQWRPNSRLRITGGFSYADSKIKDFTNSDVDGNIVDLSGSSFPNAPKFQGNLAAQYDMPIGPNLIAFAGFNYNHTSGTRGTLGFTPQLDIPAYDLVGLQTGLHAADDAWRVMVWARNLTNEYYLLGANRNGETLVGFTGMPRTFGLTGTAKFR